MAVAAGEIFLLSFLFNSPATDLPFWQQPVFYANTLAKIAFIAVPLLVVAIWPRRQEMRWLIDTPLAAGDPGLKFYLAVNIALFVILLAMRSALSGGAEPSSFALVAYSGLLLATGASMAFVAAPPAFWKRLLKLAPVEVVLALAGAVAAIIIGRLAQDGWNSLSSATLTLSHWFLTLYEPNVTLDSENRILGVGELWCSGVRPLLRL